MFSCFKSFSSSSYNVTQPARRNDYDYGRPQGPRQSSSENAKKPVLPQPLPQIPPFRPSTREPKGKTVDPSTASEVNNVQGNKEAVKTKKRLTSQGVKHNVEDREKGDVAPTRNEVDTRARAVRQTRTSSVLQDDPGTKAASAELTNGYSSNDDEEEAPQPRNGDSVTVAKSRSTAKTKAKERFEDTNPYEIPDDVDDGEVEMEEPASNHDGTNKKEKNVGFADEDTVIIVPEDDVVEPERGGPGSRSGSDVQHKLRRGGVMATVTVDTTQEIKNYPKSEE